MDEEVTLPVAAQLCGVSPDRARRMCTKHILEGRLYGGRWFIKRASVERYIQRREAVKAAEAAVA